MATFAIAATTTTFIAVVRGSSQDAAEPERLTVTMHFQTVDDWNTAASLMTYRYHVHQPLGGSNAIVDVARGAGVGMLSIEAMGTTMALLTDLRATTYLPGAIQRQATGTFLRTAPWV